MRTGIAAADPDLLPVGSVVQIDNLPAKYNGVYTIMDTGPAVQGRKIDVHVELLRGARLRAPVDPADGSAARLEPAGERTRSGEPAVPEARGRGL